MSLGGQTTPLAGGSRPETSIDAEEVRSSAAHLVQFYEADEVLAAAVAKFVADGLAAGDVVTTIATDAHMQAIDRHLQSDGVDTNAARASGRLLSLDAQETLAKFMRDGEPDRRAIRQVIGGVMAERAAVSNGARLRAYGEMVDVLWKGDQKSAALHLEELWNDLQARHSFTLLCAYAIGQFYKEPASIHGVCATHTQIVGLRHDGELGSPARAMSLPSHYAEALAREILHREEVELALRQSLRDLRTKEEELRHSEEEVRDFLENGTIALHRVGADGRILVGESGGTRPIGL